MTLIKRSSSDRGSLLPSPSSLIWAEFQGVGTLTVGRLRGRSGCIARVLFLQFSVSTLGRVSSTSLSSVKDLSPVFSPIPLPQRPETHLDGVLTSPLSYRPLDCIFNSYPHIRKYFRCYPTTYTTLYIAPYLGQRVCRCGSLSACTRERLGN